MPRDSAYRWVNEILLNDFMNHLEQYEGPQHDDLPGEMDQLAKAEGTELEDADLELAEAYLDRIFEKFKETVNELSRSCAIGTIRSLS